MKRLSKFVNRLKDVETSTQPKNTIRYLAFEQGRILIIKALRDKIEGEKYSQCRSFPHFASSMNSKGY
jgi:hypothetical protein